MDVVSDKKAPRVDWPRGESAIRGMCLSIAVGPALPMRREVLESLFTFVLTAWLQNKRFLAAIRHVCSQAPHLDRCLASLGVGFLNRRSWVRVPPAP